MCVCRGEKANDQGACPCVQREHETIIASVTKSLITLPEYKIRFRQSVRLDIWLLLSDV